VAFLILEAERRGYSVTFGDAWASAGHMAGSNHYRRLAIDLNLFKDGRYITDDEGHKELHEWWVDKCGGAEMIAGDANHYSFKHNGVI